MQVKPAKQSKAFVVRLIGKEVRVPLGLLMVTTTGEELSSCKVSFIALSCSWPAPTRCGTLILTSDTAALATAQALSSALAATSLSKVRQRPPGRSHLA
ncbi:hypothetical protein [Lysobacter capsici]|uniref:hypothetical protein n=1 Tax=Lysobacter capsici TaxID=435897 RepID=UPI001C0023CA|nr:hypothetical protein [Lysobacter capsici]QWF19484.1 hypothetical protein KME82_12440 [Lysobacter capsici]